MSWKLQRKTKRTLGWKTTFMTVFTVSWILISYLSPSKKPSHLDTPPAVTLSSHIQRLSSTVASIQKGLNTPIDTITVVSSPLPTNTRAALPPRLSKEFPNETSGSSGEKDLVEQELQSGNVRVANQPEVESLISPLKTRKIGSYANPTDVFNPVESPTPSPDFPTESQDSPGESTDLSVKVSFSVPKKFQGTTLREIKQSSSKKVIALTFDDGPWVDTTEQVLDILKKNDVKATFFWIGLHLKLYPNIGRKVVTDGHAVANHTWHHWFHSMNEATAAYEIDKTAELILKTTGVKTAYFRPPGGRLENGLAAYARKKKYAVVLWSVDPRDSSPQRPTVQTLVETVLKNAKPGGIVLLHDGGGNHETTVQALPSIISGLKKQGYTFVTVPEMLVKQPPPAEVNPVSTPEATLETELTPLVPTEALTTPPSPSDFTP